MIIASVFGDQPWWGHIIQSMSLGFHIPFKKLTFNKLTKLLEKTQSVKIKNNLTAIGDKINSEQGVKIAVKKINSYFSWYKNYAQHAVCCIGAKSGANRRFKNLI
jgi:hypothetical protein